MLSHHWLQSGDYERAHRYALLGAERARARFSHADAVGLLRRGIEAGRTAGLAREDEGQRELAHAYEQLGDSLRCLGEPDSAMRALSEASKLLRDDRLAQARVCATATRRWPNAASR